VCKGSPAYHHTDIPSCNPSKPASAHLIAEGAPRCYILEYLPALLQDHCIPLPCDTISCLSPRRVCCSIRGMAGYRHRMAHPHHRMHTRHHLANREPFRVGVECASRPILERDCPLTFSSKPGRHWTLSWTAASGSRLLSGLLPSNTIDDTQALRPGSTYG